MKKIKNAIAYLKLNYCFPVGPRIFFQINVPMGFDLAHLWALIKNSKFFSWETSK